MSTIRVAGPAPYDVLVGHGVEARLPELLGRDVRRVAVIHAPGLGVDPAALDGVDVLDIELPDGEAAKTAAVVADCWERLGAAGFTRSGSRAGDKLAQFRVDLVGPNLPRPDRFDKVVAAGRWGR